MFAETYTAEEVDGIVSFYKSPPGQALLQKQQIVGTKAFDFAQRQVSDAMPEIRKLTDEWTAATTSRYRKPQ
jgi:hypothetical protein